jgi:hypothetical protein
VPLKIKALALLEAVSDTLFGAHKVVELLAKTLGVRGANVVVKPMATAPGAIQFDVVPVNAKLVRAPLNAFPDRS